MKYLPLFLLVFFAACKGPKNAAGYRYSADSRIEMSKGPCFGSCPVYDIAISGDGKAAYTGKTYAPREGSFQRTLSAQEANALFEAVEKADFFAFEDMYTEEVTDLPATWITFTHKGKTKKIYAYYGVPESLRSLIRLVEAEADKDGWAPAN